MDKPKVKVFTKMSSRTVPTNKIKIPYGWLRSEPNPDEQALCFERYIDNGYFDRTITIDDRGFIKDGYMAYRVAKVLGLETVKVSQLRTVIVLPEIEEVTPPEPIKRTFWQRVFGKGELICQKN